MSVSAPASDFSSVELPKNLCDPPSPSSPLVATGERSHSQSAGGGQLILPPIQSGVTTQSPVLASRRSSQQVAVKAARTSSPNVTRLQQGPPAALDSVPAELLVSLVRQRKQASNVTSGSTGGIHAYDPATGDRRAKKTSLTISATKPSPAWHYPAQRARFKHLTEQPVCFCGAGKDVSFLYDTEPMALKKEKRTSTKAMTLVPLPVTSKEGKATDQSNVKTDIPKTLIPGNYHVVKAAGVLGVDIFDSNHTTQIVDHPRHAVAFPSLNPAGRQQVLALKGALTDMLRGAGLDDAGFEVTGPTQVHKLLKLVKKEQDIYNVCFHEVIRQVSVECIERGQLLADIRDRYSKLMSKIPDHVLGLHEELLAQRSLDRQLVCELQRFQGEVERMSDDLKSVHFRDEEVRLEAQIVKEELSQALEGSQKNANLLTEYHELYELQRHRLEFQIEKLSAEKDLWQDAAHGLALKVTDEQSLSSCRRLQLCERCWYKLAMHFAVLLSDNDLQEISKVQEHVHEWQRNISKLCQYVDSQDGSFLSQMRETRAEMKAWSERFFGEVMVEGGGVQPLVGTSLEELQAAFKKWETTTTSLAERFGGQSVVEAGEMVDDLRKSMRSWDKLASVLYGRHRQADGSPHQHTANMQAVNKSVGEFHRKLAIRVSGENGVADSITHLVGPLETWSNKLTAAVQTGRTIVDAEWLKMQTLLYDWQQMICDVMLHVGKTSPPSDTPSLDQQETSSGKTPEVEPHTDPSQLTGEVRNWVSTSMHALEMDDNRIMHQVADVHGELVHWTIKLLLELTKTPAQREQDKQQKLRVGIWHEMAEERGEVRAEVQPGQDSLATLRIKCQMLTNQVDSFTSVLFKCCSDVIQNRFATGTSFKDIDEDEDYKDLQRLQAESEDWAQMSELLLTEVDAVVRGLAPSSAVTSAADIAVAASKQNTETKEQGLQVPTPGTSAGQPSQTPALLATDTAAAATATQDTTAATIPEVEEEKTPPETGPVPVHVLGVDENVHPRQLDGILPLEDSTRDSHVTPLQADAALPKSDFGLESEAFAEAVEDVRKQSNEWEQRCHNAEVRAETSEREVENLKKQIEELQQKAKESLKGSRKSALLERRDPSSRGSTRPPSGVRRGGT